MLYNMLFLQQHLLIFFQITLVALILSISGFLLKLKLLKGEDIDNFEENGLLGFVLVGFISLIINFIFPLNFIVNNILLLTILVLGYKQKFFLKNNINLIKKILFVSFVSYVFIIYANVNNPDAFLYHLPYSKILNDSKIIIGLSNLHFRFGHISIFQYISSFFVNNIFNTNGLLIPISLVPSFFFIFCLKEIQKYIKNRNFNSNSYIIFLILIVSIYSFSRYSGWGNDAQVHIYYFLTIIYFLKYTGNDQNFNTFYKLSLTSVFTFFMKPFYLITILFPLFIFFINRNKISIIKSKTTIFLSIFLIFWFLKSILITSCLIYPIDFSCIKTTSWYNPNTIEIAKQGEVWAKDWPNRNNNSITINDYLHKFNWVSTWSQNHLKIIVQKILPVILFIILNIIFLFFAKCLRLKQNKEKNKFYIYILIVNFIGVSIWFYKFPIFRYGQSYIYSLLIFTFYFIFIKNINFSKLSKFYNIIIIVIIVGFSGMFFKNINRIIKTENENITPKIFDKNNKNEVVKYFNKNGVFIHYKNPRGLCGYSPSPCNLVNMEIKKNKKFTYTIFGN